MAEMIIPGTYIAVRAEGLVSAGRIATGIVGVVGTASAGPVNQPVTLADPASAREIFGPYDEPGPGPDSEPPILTLSRSLEYLYANGATSIIAVRVAGKSAATAAYSLKGTEGDPLATLKALTPGTWGNSIGISIGPASAPGRIVGEIWDSASGEIRDAASEKYALRYPEIRPSPENRIQIIKGKTREVRSLSLRYGTLATGVLGGTADGGYTVPMDSLDDKNTILAVRFIDSNDVPSRAYGIQDISFEEGTGDPAKGKIRIDRTGGKIAFAPDEAPAKGRVHRTEVIWESPPADPGPGEVVMLRNGVLVFAEGEGPTQDGDRLISDYLIDPQSCVEITLSRGAVKETYTVPDAHVLAGRLSSSRLARAESTKAGKRPATTQGTAYFGSGGETAEPDSNTAGNDGADAGSDEYRAGLDLLSDRLVNIVLLAGQDAGSMGGLLVGHLKATEEIDRERIGVIGAGGGSIPGYLAHTLAEDRVVLVAPGLRLEDGRCLPPAYAAAAVAGLIASLPVQASLTNKVVNVPGLRPEPDRGEQEQLIRRNVLALARKEGFRVVKGMTTQGEGQPFSSIPVRRIVDYAKYGVRSAANPYLGKLNNERVRAALKSALDAFLTRMVEDEALTGYELDVAATRAQEIGGEVSVIMTLRPTFSIDYIRVTMNLQ